MRLIQSFRTPRQRTAVAAKQSTGFDSIGFEAGALGI
ncbi:hypothetical protein L915_00157 [Phytophthora nicotianae]|uniref:Uncharacterized protein n=1 Tax=Phytophthora nicotianae TaxID=4792 RepID=W2JXY3_PHYNI|nr:hypothetical protein L915_00157 [Phytophthora nicotianae]ETL50632.1 hypothetical protein L916_00158 [Phytophthora nicotianae]